MRELTPDEIKYCRWISDDLKLLARLHAYELDEDTFVQLKKCKFPESLLLLNDDPNKPILPVIKSGLLEIENKQVTWDALAADFAAIYLNVSYQASPNESAWLDEDHLERQEPMFEIRNWYSKYHLTIPNWRIRQEDNLSLQLLFIAHLLSQKEIPIRDINHFMDFHILRWIGSFSELVFKRAETAFYASLAVVTARLLNEFRDELAEMEEKSRPSAQDIEMATTKEKREIVYDPLFYSSQNGGW